MNKRELSKSMRRLPVADRLELLEELSCSVAADQREIRVPAWQKKLLDKRMAEFEADPTNVITLAEFRAKLRALRNKLKSTSRRKAS